MVCISRAYSKTDIKNKDTLLQEYHLQITILLTVGYILSKLAGNNVLVSILFILISVEAFLSNTRQLTYLLFLFSPMFLYVTIGEFPVYNIIIGVLAFKRLVIEKIKIHPIFILAVVYLIIIELIGMLVSGVGFSFNQIKFFVIILITTMQLYEPCDKYENMVAAQYLIWGTLVYAVFYIVTNYNTLINSSARSGGLGDLDPNTYAMYNLFAVAIALLFVVNKLFNIKDLIMYTLTSIVIFIAGIMALSKTYLLVTLLMLALFWLFKKEKLKISLFYIIIILMIVCLIQNNTFFNQTFNNLILRFTTASNLDQLTTGRSTLLSEYIDALSSRNIILLFGSGMYSYLSTLGFLERPHNSILEVLCAWGIIGTTVLFIMYKKAGEIYRRNIKYTGNIKLINVVPLLLLLVFMQSLTLMFEEATYAYIVMGIMILYSPSNKHKCDLISR